MSGGVEYLLSFSSVDMHGETNIDFYNVVHADITDSISNFKLESCKSPECVYFCVLHSIFT